MRPILILVCAVGLALAAPGCGSSGPDAKDENQSIVVTTNVLGDVVRSIVGNDATVRVLIPADTDPHEFAPSTSDAELLTSAALVISNGLGFEEGLEDALSAAASSGAEVLAVGDHVDPRPDDPHWFTDPTRMLRAVGVIATEIEQRVPALDTAAFASRVAAYEQQLRDLDASITRTLAAIPADRRRLVTNHEALSYFAAKYGFEFIGAVIPSTSTGAEPSARDLETLAEQIRAAGVRAIFADASSPTKLAEALRDEVGGTVTVVELYTESLGPEGSGADTYLSMLQHDADVIADALT